MVVRTVTNLLCRMMLDSSAEVNSELLGNLFTSKVRVRGSAKYKIASLPGLEGKIGSLHICSRILENQNILKQ